MKVSERVVSTWQFYFVLSLWVVALFLPLIVHANGIRRVDDDLSWSPVTISMCFCGWFLSWSSHWATKWVQEKKCLTNYMLENFPRIVIGLISTACCYVLLPEIGKLVNYEIRIGNLGAFVVGLSSDVIVHRLRDLIPKKKTSPPPPPEGT